VARVERWVLDEWRRLPSEAKRELPSTRQQEAGSPPVRFLRAVLVNVSQSAYVPQRPTEETLTEVEVHALCQVVDWLFVDTSPHACLAFLSPSSGSSSSPQQFGHEVEKEQVFCFLGPVALRFLAKELIGKDHPFVLKLAEHAKSSWTTTLWKRLGLAAVPSSSTEKKWVGVAAVLLRCLATIERQVRTIAGVKGAAASKGKIRAKPVPTRLQADQERLIEDTLLLSDEAELVKGMLHPLPQVLMSLFL
jgi:hypothetical protein